MEPFKRKSSGAGVTDYWKLARAGSREVNQKSLGIWVIVRGQVPPELQDGLTRDFTPEEKIEIFGRVNRTLAPPSSNPAVLFVLGPSAVGKSSITISMSFRLFGSPHNAVMLDGAEFRQVHAGFGAVTNHGLQKRVLHADAWDALKNAGGPGGPTGWLKQEILDLAVNDRQSLIVPDCVNKPAKLRKMMELLRTSGYALHAVCLWAPLSETRRRGEPRCIIIVSHALAMIAH